MFIGFMGVGKTTIGNLVAKKLYRDFIDIDHEIEQEYGMSIPEIFSEIGEEAFRKKEKEVISTICQKKLKVISVGGGAFLQEEVKQLCLDSCIVFYLDLSWGSWKERVNLIIDSRPVLKGKSMEDMEKLFYERQEIYANHHSKVNVDKKEAEEIAEHVVDSIKLSWELYE
ncbi:MULTISPECIES: shikimate kinase [Bacillaceae]|uniref:Shikimate kinase n=1 Tax=Evansella alkalicola TaxID=745819 RepID=A0ABS6JQU6_9BACI|nr:MULTISPECIES: shikimate kinase [Bacillaceae]MBU9720919.1 shikimate kinase [Bacillus alkalicola]